MYTIALDNGVEQLKVVLETFSSEPDSPISTTKIDEIVSAIQLQNDGDEEDIEINVSLGSQTSELLIKSSTIDATSPKVSISTDSNKVAEKIKNIVR